MNANERRIKLIYLLQSSQRVFVKDIMSYFDISRRTAFRYLRSLSEMGVPYYYDEKLGYKIVKESSLPSFMFNERELAVLLAGLNFIRAQSDEVLLKDASSVELKIKNTLPPDKRAYFKAMFQSILINPYRAKPIQKASGIWLLFARAMTEKRFVKFSYKDIRGKISERKIQPTYLIFFEDHWDIIGYDAVKQKYRTFVLDRCARSHILEAGSILSPKSWEEIRNQDAETVTVTLTTPKRLSEELITKLPVLCPVVIPKGKRHEITFPFDNLPYLNKFLLQFGPEIKIESPKILKSLRDKILQEYLKANT